MAKRHSTSHGPLPVAPIERWLTPVQRFMQIEASSGVLLLVCALAALALANSPLSEWYLSLWRLPFQVGIGAWTLVEDAQHVVNDGLMTVFFFVVGLEIKREMVAGELRSPRKAALPIAAAIGGMAAPAAIFLALGSAFRLPAEAFRGWAVPMATDIAFVVGILALFGRRVPFGLKISLLTLAIVDDLGAVLVIALVFTEEIRWGALAAAGAGFGITYGLNLLGVRRATVYILVGMGIWYAVLKSGVHPTVAGMLLGLLTPASAWVGDKALLEVVEDLMARLKGGSASQEEGLTEALDRTAFAAREAISPLTRLEEGLHPWVAFAIMPLFALANAGVPISAEGVRDPLAYVVAAGLMVGKPVGIIGFSWLAVRAGVARLPEGVTWGMLLGGGCLAGIGFTMAIFLATLSLPAYEIEAGKLGIFLGSLVSAILGAIILTRATRKQGEAGR